MVALHFVDTAQAMEPVPMIRIGSKWMVTGMFFGPKHLEESAKTEHRR